MPSLSKLIAWSAVAIAASASAMPNPQAENPIDPRDVNIILNTHDEIPSPIAKSAPTPCTPNGCSYTCASYAHLPGTCGTDGKCTCAIPSPAANTGTPSGLDQMPLKAEGCAA